MTVSSNQNSPMPPASGSLSPPVDATDAALARLASTRQRLLQTMAPRVYGNRAAGPSSSGMAQRLLALGRMLLSRGPSDALLRAVKSTASQWWHAQPWAGTAGLVGHALAREVKPVVQRHPWLTVTAALLLGAAIVPARPWLARAVRRHAGSVGTRMSRAAWGMLTQAPVQMALAAALAAWVGGQKRQSDAQTAQPAESGTDATEPVPSSSAHLGQNPPD